MMASSPSSRCPSTQLYARTPKSSSSVSPTSSASESPAASSSSISPVKIEALKGVVDVIEKNYGKGSIQKLGDAKAMNVETTSSGSITLDMALGGGYPRGRVVEIFGPESSGKTTLALHAIAEVQKAGGKYFSFNIHPAWDAEI
jgi:recombination protein RecA